MKRTKGRKDERTKGRKNALSFSLPLALWGPPLLWMSLIFLGSSLTGGHADDLTRQASGVNEPIQIQRIKDVFHITEYGILTLLLIRAFTGRSYRPSLKQTWLAFIIASLYGVSDELHQYYVPSRYPGLDDIIRNILGAALAAGLMYIIAHYRKRSQHL